MHGESRMREFKVTMIELVGAILLNQKTNILDTILTIKSLEDIVTVLCHIFLCCNPRTVDLNVMLHIAIGSITVPK